jgi:2-polyprenyl-3-methyl-5-hydroxy-6-metoxy-1,4-benzoquinol methylase
METTPLIQNTDDLRREIAQGDFSYVGEDSAYWDDLQDVHFLNEVADPAWVEIQALQPVPGNHDMPLTSDEAALYDQIWHQCWGDVQRYGPSHRIHRDILLEMLEQLRFGTLLEVGCGNGMNLFAIRQAFPAVKLAGTDISGEALTQLQKVLPDIPVYRVDATRYALQKQYDVVISLDVLEHIENDVAVINHMYHMSKKYVLISTLQGRMRKPERAIGHVRNYASGELQRKMEKAGFTIEETIEWGWPLFSPLYRDFLFHAGGQQHTFGRYGPLKRLACQIIYRLFRLNSCRRGDMLFVLGSKR